MLEIEVDKQENRHNLASLIKQNFAPSGLARLSQTQMPKKQLIGLVFSLNHDTKLILKIIDFYKPKTIASKFVKTRMQKYFLTLDEKSGELFSALAHSKGKGLLDHFITERIIELKTTLLDFKLLIDHDLIDISHKKKFMSQLNDLKKAQGITSFLQLLQLFQEKEFIIKIDIFDQMEKFLKNHIKNSMMFPDMNKKKRQIMIHKSELSKTSQNLHTFFFMNLKFKLIYAPFVLFDCTNGFVMENKNHAVNYFKDVNKTIIVDPSYKDGEKVYHKLNGQKLQGVKTITDKRLLNLIRVFFSQESFWYDTYRRMLANNAKNNFRLRLGVKVPVYAFDSNNLNAKAPFGMRVDNGPTKVLELDPYTKLEIRYPVIEHITPYLL